MATANLGRVGFVNKGTYSGATAYKVNDVVVYNSGTYACIQANTGQAVTNTSYWQVWVEDGAVHKTGNETIADIKTFTSSPIVPVPTLVNQAISMGNIIEKTSVGIGYGTGSGGTVTQLTSKSTAVTLNKPCGVITTHNASLTNSTTVSFSFFNTSLDLGDTLILTFDNSAGTPSSYLIWSAVQNDVATISIRNVSAAPLSEALKINYSIIKAVTA